MTNHCHTHAITKKAAALPKFYGEYQKKITDALKALFRIRKLSIWEDRTAVILVEDIEDCISRLIYMFSNPAKAGLVNSIDEYPGISSWAAFQTCEPRIDAEVKINAPWVPVAAIPEIRRVLTKKEDRKAVETMHASHRAVCHEIILRPFAWLAQYGVTEPAQIEKIRMKVITGVRLNEQAFKLSREKAGKDVIGAEKLRRCPYFTQHTPKQSERRIFLICGDKARRIELLEYFAEVFQCCRECYEKAKAGIRTEWPPGTFVPTFPPVIGHTMA